MTGAMGSASVASIFGLLARVPASAGRDLGPGSDEHADRVAPESRALRRAGGFQHHPIAAHVQVDEIVHMPRLANARRAHHVEWIATLPELRPMRVTLVQSGWLGPASIAKRKHCVLLIWYRRDDNCTASGHPLSKLVSLN